jgi:hypothetical protein
VQAIRRIGQDILIDEPQPHARIVSPDQLLLVD